tara:strand:+ start:7711 stop:8448 length:738 start_codon:yes stop_codon:yes gene_type:complete
MINIEIGENLKNLTENKRVALVGPAPYLIDSNVGEQLDQYDLICRVNDLIPPEHLRKDYGSRTDIMFHNLGTPWIAGLERKTVQHPEHFKNLKMVVCPVIKSDHSELSYLNWQDHYVSNVVNNFDKINKHDIPFNWIGVKEYKKVYNDVGVEFNSGLGAMIMLCNCPVKELLITGFTFYLGGSTHDELYYDGHWDKQNLAKTTVGLSGGHGYNANMAQIGYFRNMVSEPPKVVLIDSYMKQLFKL